jgi:fucose 4-O-acetylase-like acetyltransferase
MRGICIIAVVLTHVIPKNDITADYDVWIQNLINIAVAGFIFLSGYFTNIIKASESSVKYVKQRIIRLLPPYILWSIFYIIISVLYGKYYSFLDLLKVLAFGKAAGPLYYLLILFWLTLFTPLVAKRMNNKYWNFLFLLITPISYLFLYYYQLKISPIYFTGALLPTSWFIYYYLGLKWQKLSPKLPFPSIISLLIIGYVIELAETYFILNHSNDIQFATTPLRFSPFIYIVSFIFLFLKLKDKHYGNNNVFVSLGNKSYGIYLAHIFVLGYVSAAIRMVWYGMVWYGMVWYGMVHITNCYYSTNYIVNLSFRHKNFPEDFSSKIFINDRFCIV